MTDDPRTIYLADYQAYPFVVAKVALTFRLHPSATRVKALLHLAPNPARPGRHDLRLQGEGLTLCALALNGAPLSQTADAAGLTIPAALLPEGAFTLETEVEINPAANTALEGLYISNGMYCTQCEAEGFRKITYYPDRPDVMAPFAVRIESDLPVLLSNGNPGAVGQGFAEWHDPWPKPSYLFALVAGDLVAHTADFTTASGRKVALNIWVRPGDEGRCAYAMDSLIRSMRWDEEKYGREYDLDVFNIVAVDDFNLGAMENKGLNIFNAKFVLASPETATDEDYARIEAIIAHEYFHNWTGNRITCRDWFQLCLKEGLTVFRDQQFSGDMRSPAMKRIEDVLTLRGRQFREDAGPLAHPVRPESFVEINNFYTGTIYEKGAEVIGMLKVLVGDEAYAKALDLYFTRHDGEAATIEDWLKVFEDVTGRDLSQFKLWYQEAGTPRLHVRESWDEARGRFTLTLRQENPPTPGQPVKKAKVIPVAVGLLNPNGDALRGTEVLELTEEEQSFPFDGLSARPVPSLLRGFSAPVILRHEARPETRAFLLAHDTDPFAKWEAGRALAKEGLMASITQGAAPADEWLEAMVLVAGDESLDPAFRALALRLPSEDDLAESLHQAGHLPDPDALHTARGAWAGALARRLSPGFAAAMARLATPGPFKSDAAGSGKRALRAALLALETRVDGGAAARAAFAAASNMSETLAALIALCEAGLGEAELAAFAARWQSERLVMDKWFALQVQFAPPGALAARAEALVQRPDFEVKNPNRARAVLGSLPLNHAGFHGADGAAYRFLAAWLVKIDALNPQMAARLSGAFETWRRYDGGRQAAARAALAEVAAAPGLSRDLSEMVARMRGD